MDFNLPGFNVYEFFYCFCIYWESGNAPQRLTTTTITWFYIEKRTWQEEERNQ